MTKKQFLRSVVFFLVVCGVLYLLCDIFELENSTNRDKRFTTFRNLNEDTVDAVLVGTSGVDRYWISAKAYEEYGMTTYVMASDAMPAWMYTHVIDDIYAYQNPELIIVDMRAFGQRYDDQDKMDARARRVLDSMDFLSVNRVKAAFSTMKAFYEIYEDAPRFDLSYLLPYIKYHEKWWDNDFRIKDNLGNLEHEYLGFFMSNKLSLACEPQQRIVYDPEHYEALEPVAEEALYDLIEYAERKGIELLFLDTPQFKSDEEVGCSNTVSAILEEKGLNYINYSITDENGDFLYDLGLDPGKDYYDEGHTNYYGAEKFTSVFAEYLNDNYDLEDHREDSAVQEQWDGVYAKIQEKIAALKG